jgi:DNA transformation protein
MAVSSSYKAFVTELLGGVGPITIRSMFGGAGVYADGVMFGLIAADTLYLKTDAAGAADFKAEGSAPFRYDTSQGTNTLGSFWQVPEWLYDEPEDMTRWAERALAVARAKAKPKQPKARSGPVSGAGPKAQTRRPSRAR